MNYEALRNMLFLLPAEVSHHVSMQSIGLMEQLNLTSLIARDVPDDPVEVMGIRFPNRVGLAAGLDKDAACIDGLAAMGFGFLEVGTVTPLAQDGNAKPRMFRLKDKQALINRMGFNNQGVDPMCKRVRRSKFNGVLGINIGKNTTTSVGDALADYIFCMRKVYKQASYVAVNISSPNSPGLRDLQKESELARLIEGLKQEHEALKEKFGKHVPLVVKIAPDMDDEDMTNLARRLLSFELDGVIVSNTTVSRGAVAGERHAIQSGGLSGAPLRSQANHALSLVSNEVKGKMAVIGVGGIVKGEDAAEKIRLGADLVQIYTGFIYQGPDLISNCVKSMKS
jgi:dihydroorotate dehydrogenase